MQGGALLQHPPPQPAPIRVGCADCGWVTDLAENERVKVCGVAAWATDEREVLRFGRERHGLIGWGMV